MLIPSNQEFLLQTFQEIAHEVATSPHEETHVSSKKPFIFGLILLAFLIFKIKK
jgi:hypothetical protein